MLMNYEYMTGPIGEADIFWGLVEVHIVRDYMSFNVVSLPLCSCCRSLAFNLHDILEKKTLRISGHSEIPHASNE